MMLDLQPELTQRSTAIEQSPGIQTILIPFHIVKYTLRSGGGDIAQPGMTLSCLVDIFTSDGTQLTNSKGGKITRFLIGRGRLIYGLQVGLMSVRRDEKLRLAISPDYAYGGQQDIPLVPPQTRLIFEIQVLQVERVPLQRMNDTQLYYQVFYYLQRADECLQRRQQASGIDHLKTALLYARRIKNPRCWIVGRILLKLGSIYCYNQLYVEALAIISSADKYQNSIQDCLRIYIRIYQSMGQKEKLDQLVQRFYYEHLYQNSVRRICVEYYKEIGSWQKLKKLQGYDFKKDRLHSVKPQPIETPFNMRVFFA